MTTPPHNSFTTNNDSFSTEIVPCPTPPLMTTNLQRIQYTVIEILLVWTAPLAKIMGDTKLQMGGRKWPSLLHLGPVPDKAAPLRRLGLTLRLWSPLAAFLAHKVKQQTEFEPGP